MRVLWVKAGKLLPIDTGGKIRSYNLLRQLDREHSLTLLSYYGEGLDAAYERDLGRHFRSPVPMAVQLPSGSATGYIRHLASAAPYAVTKFAAAAVRNRVAAWLNEDRFDVVVCDFLSASLNIPAETTTPVVLFQHNVESLLWKRQATHEAHPLKRIAFRLEAAKMARYEKAALRRFNHVIAVSDADRDAMATMGDPARISVVPTGVDVAMYQPAARVEPSSPIVMFLGSMDWEANIDAVDHFCHDVWPSVVHSVPGARFRVVGRNPPQRIRDLAGSSIEVTGTVPSVVEYLEQAAVVVVPLRIGGGTRLKIFEAMAAGRAVVSSAIGAEGLDVVSGDDVVIADEPRTFGRAVIELLTDGDRRRAIGRRAAETAAKHDWSGIAKQFGSVLAHIAAGRNDRTESPAPVLRVAL